MKFLPIKYRQLVSCLSALVLSAGASPAVEIEMSTVFAYPKRDPYDLANLHGFNHAPNVTVMPDGHLLAAWFSGPYEGSVHQLILGSVSEDGAKSWSDAKVIQDTPRTSDFDPAFVRDGTNTLLFYAAGRWNRYPFVGVREAAKKLVGTNSFHVLSMVSPDSGRTWSDPVQAVPGRLFCRANGIRLRSGTLLLPVYDLVNESYVASVLRSEDRGQSWTKHGTVTAADGKAGAEPTIVELDNGNILMALRSRDGRIWFALSTDEGTTWQEPFSADFDAAASSHSLFRTSSGRVLLTYSASKPPLRSPLVIRQLDQKNMQWGDPVRIASIKDPEEPFWTTQVSYPSVTELPDGTLVVVWTEIAMSPAEQYGKIMSARVKL